MKPKLIRDYEEAVANKPEGMKYDWQYVPEKLRIVSDYYLWWRPSPKEIVRAREIFYTKLMPIAQGMYFDHDSMYRDYAQEYSTYADRSFFASYTPFGIQKIDSYFCYRILTLESKEEALILEEEIIGCHHLHIKIRENLIGNLFNSSVFK